MFKKLELFNLVVEKSRFEFLNFTLILSEQSKQAAVLWPFMENG